MLEALNIKIQNTKIFVYIPSHNLEDIDFENPLDGSLLDASKRDW